MSSESLLPRNISLQLAYLGTSFFGWEENNAGPSIEGALRAALEKILQERVLLFAASRTDRGVHAEKQVVNFYTRNNISIENLIKGVNALLPFAIRVFSMREMAASFHATLDAVGKHYHYEIDLGPYQSPFRAHLAWHVPYQIDLEKVTHVLPFFLGKKDFSSFANVKKGTVAESFCEITAFSVEEPEKNRLIFTLLGNRFLYKMVRNIIGTTIAIGRGKMDADHLKQLFLINKRSEAGMTAPAHGLTLKKVFYSEEILDNI